MIELGYCIGKCLAEPKPLWFLGWFGLCVVTGTYKLVVHLPMFSHLWREKWSCGGLGTTPQSSDGSAGSHPAEAEWWGLAWNYLQQAFALGMCFRTDKSREIWNYFITCILGWPAPKQTVSPRSICESPILPLCASFMDEHRKVVAFSHWSLVDNHFLTGGHVRLRECAEIYANMCRCMQICNLLFPHLLLQRLLVGMQSSKIIQLRGMLWECQECQVPQSLGIQ